MKIRILVCGDRFWTNKKAIERELMFVLERVGGNPADITVIEGACSGADTMAGEVAKELGFAETLVFPANWELYGKAAGPIRNKQMLTEGKPDLVLAFHPNIKESRGTGNMVSLAEKAGVPTVVFDK